MGELAERELMKKGAEASLFLADWQGKQAVIKVRFPKAYRPEKLDLSIRTYRTIHEPQLINEAKKAGVSTPLIFQVDVKNATLIMEFVEGRQVKVLLSSCSAEERQALCLRIGRSVAKMHRHGLVHGDLTTSNMILTPEGRLVLVDFGLGEKNSELEARAVDLHLIKRALQSTHFNFAEECFGAIIKGYKSILGEEEGKNVLVKVREIERRGRYVDERKQKVSA